MNEDQKRITAVLEGNAFNAYEPGDRKKKPTPVLVRHMTNDEVKNLVQGAWYEFTNGNNVEFQRLYRVRVSSIKLRGRGNLRGVESIKMKFGLKEYWDWTPEACMAYLIVRL